MISKHQRPHRKPVIFAVILAAAVSVFSGTAFTQTTKTFEVLGTVKSEGVQLSTGAVVFPDNTQMTTRPKLITKAFLCEASGGRKTAIKECVFNTPYAFCALSAMGQWNDPAANHYPRDNFSCDILYWKGGITIAVRANKGDYAECRYACITAFKGVTVENQ